MRIMMVMGAEQLEKARFHGTLWSAEIDDPRDAYVSAAPSK